MLQMPSHEMLRVIANVQRVFKQLHSGQHQHTAALLAALFDGVTTSHAAALSTFPPDTIRKARLAYADNIFGSELFTSKAVKTGTGSRKRYMERSHDAHAFLESTTRVSVSGDKRDRFQSFGSQWDTFKRYKIKGGCAGWSIFVGAWEKLGVTLAPHQEFDFFSCHQCSGAPERIKQLTTELAALRQLHGVDGNNYANLASSSIVKLDMLSKEAEIAKIQVINLLTSSVDHCFMHYSQHFVHFHRLTLSSLKRNVPSFKRLATISNTTSST